MVLANERTRHQVRTASSRARNGGASPAPLVGDAIFEGTDYPRRWDEFVGQTRAVAQIKAACFSARVRQQRMDHCLIASGIAGIGKTSLAKLIAADLGTGLVEISGKVSVDDVRPILQGMSDYDVLFFDEIHQAVAGGAAKAEWLLQLLQDGTLVTKTGVDVLPKITVIAATTDVQKLPTTIIGRFPLKPVLEPYTVMEAQMIASTVATKLGFGGEMLPHYSDMELIARASNGNPRDMRALLIALRDSYFVNQSFDIDLALDWVGVTRDGLTRVAQDYLITMLTMFEGMAGQSSMQSALNEPGPLRHTEQLLIQAGYLLVTPSGRQMTEDGVTRTSALLVERGLLEETP